MAFVFTVDTTQPGSSNTNFVLPLRSAGDYDFFVDWGDAGGEDYITAYNQAEVTHTYSVTGIYQISITGVGLSGWEFGGGGDDDKLLTIDNWGPDVLTINNDEAFEGCSNLTTATTGSPNLIGSMSQMFNGCSNFVSGVKDFDMSQVTNATSMFQNCTNFDDDLSSWDTSGIVYMSDMFSNATSFNNAGQTGIGNWNLSSTTTMASMFYNADSFNQPIHTWVMPTSNCTAVNMFQNNGAFNNGGVSMSSWDTSNITNMSQLFYNATAFNQAVSGWNVSNVTNMISLFRGATSFNQNIQPWDTSNVTDATNMFIGATAFNNGGLSMDNMDWGSCVNFVNMFHSAITFNQSVSNWNVSSATSLASMFYNADSFNQDISNWTMPVSSCTAVNMFQNNGAFNNGGVSMSSWDTSNITNMSQLFYNAIAFNQAVSGWNVSNVTNMISLFRGATSFNQNIQPWDTSNVTDPANMFLGATAFNNGGLSMDNMDWGSCVNFINMFNSAINFNQSVSSWNVSGATSFSSMFNNADSFNQDISDWIMPVSSCTAVNMFLNNGAFNNGGVSMSSWDTSNLTNMSQTFYNATSFNQPVSGWDVSSVTNMASTFRGATSFDQTLSGWDISNVTNISNFLLSAGLSCDNYDSTLLYWATLDLVDSRSFHGGNSNFTPLGSGARQSIIDDDSWSFTDGGVVTVGPSGVDFTVDIDESGNYTVGTSTILTVSAIGTGECTDKTTLGSTYQWYKTTGTDASVGVAIGGETSASYSYSPILSDDGSGLYAVSISTNDYGTAIGTGTVQLLFISGGGGGGGDGIWPYSGMPVMTGINGTTTAYNSNIIINYPGKRGLPGNNAGIISGDPTLGATTYFSGVLADRLRGRYRY